MPEKPLTIATYAVGASLCAISLLYVFGPTFVLDSDTSSSKRGVVGLVNPSNDCFINSVLQALAGLPDLRKYLIRETHRRNLDGADVYKVLELRASSGKSVDIKAWKLEGLQQGVVTHALKDVLDRLNERPIYRKAISAQDFISALEQAFRTRISRQQQDAQEFLQVVTERLCDEYYAGRQARRKYKARNSSVLPASDHQATGNGRIAIPSETKETFPIPQGSEETPAEDPFPFEGRIEAQIECETCKFKPKPAISTFVTLTLNVPHSSQTTLNHCFDGMLKVEKIDDFKCDKCRLEHAKLWKESELGRTTDPSRQSRLRKELGQIKSALEEDPERELPDANLPNIKLAPKRRILRHMRIASFPKILAIHLSRSMYSATSLSTKNTAKVSFPEMLPLGGLLDIRQFRLLCVVTHKGGHNSGHYETFRRQAAAIPFSTPHSFGGGGVYSRQGTPNPSAIQSPRLSAQNSIATGHDSISALPSFIPTPDAARFPSPQPTSSSSSVSSRSSLSISSSFRRRRAPTSAPRAEGGSSLPAATPQARISVSRPPTESDVERFRYKQKKRESRWWRISDDKIKESKTGDVLSMQKEAYLLFYELQQ
jgi:ubiquitin carboxyl-terminal hydrolase 16